jgi:hypothetical protein
VLSLDEEKFPKSSLSVVLVGTASDNAVIGEEIIIGLNAREYITSERFAPIELYHFSDKAHLVPISSKISRGSSLYITGHLSIIEDLFLVKLTHVNYISSNFTSSYKSKLGYAWEKGQTDSTQSSAPSAADIAKSILSSNAKSRKKRKRKASTPLTGPVQKIPNLASLSLTQPSADNQDEVTGWQIYDQRIWND